MEGIGAGQISCCEAEKPFTMTMSYGEIVSKGALAENIFVSELVFAEPSV